MTHSVLLNNHAWYALDDAWDWLRMVVYVVSNLIIAGSYLLIPREIAAWRAVLPFTFSRVMGHEFMAFIRSCALTHIVMLLVMVTAPWWAIPVSVYCAYCSARTTYRLRTNRTIIVSFFQHLSTDLVSAMGSHAGHE